MNASPRDVSTDPAVIVSGGSRGLGLNIVRTLLEKGYRVSTFSRHATDDIQELLNTAPEHFYFSTADLDDSHSLKLFVSDMEERLGAPGYLVNNAGIVREALLGRQTEDEILHVLDVNLRGSLLLTRMVARKMMIHRFGRIVNISSVVSIRGFKGTAAYAATKGGIDAMTRALARELGGRNITVNSIAPGYLDTDMTQGMNQDQLRQIVRRTPLGRAGTAEDVAGVVAFLLSSDARFVSGQTIVVDGGFTC